MLSRPRRIAHNDRDPNRTRPDARAPIYPSAMAAPFLRSLQESRICTQLRYFAGRAVMACAALGGARWRPLTAGFRQSGPPPTPTPPPPPVPGQS